MISVFRSMDEDAAEDADCIVELLTDAGIQAVLLDDSAPGVPEGVFEVRVPAADAARAEQLIAENPPGDAEEVDPSPGFDLETIASGASEMEATGIKNVLDANGITAVLVGDSVLPMLTFQVRVARDQTARARLLIADAEAKGPAAAEEAERASES
jgi:Putative prokaryotic signal transducing protein